MTAAEGPCAVSDVQMQMARAGRPGWREHVSGAVEDHGAVVVQGVGVRDDEALLDVVSLVGTPSQVGNGGELIYDVTPQVSGGDLSRTTRPFPPHTDSTFLPEPHGRIALGCVQAPPDGGGGRSCVVSAGDVAAELCRRHGDDVVAALSEPAFPFSVHEPGGESRVRLLAILERADDGRYRVRYRLDAIIGALREEGIVLSPRHGAALSAFEEVLGDPALQATHALRPGDVLIVDNRRMLHGRTAIGEDAQRLLRRVKLDAA